MTKTIFITDTHLYDKTVEINKDIFSQVIKYAKENNIKLIFHTGDIFTSRKAQTELTLKTFTEILDDFEKNGLTLIAIPGNHDKTDYSSSDSFLDVYKYHPAFDLITEPTAIKLNQNINIVMLPFFDEETVFAKKLEKANKLTEPDKVNILATHVAISGVKNNDGSEVKNKLTKNKFKKYQSVLVGHYHNTMQFNQVFYFGSAYQANFGEDDKKGFLVLEADAEKVKFKRIQTKFKKYVKFKLDVSKETLDNISEKVLTEKAKDNFVRVEIIGEESVIKSINTSDLKKSGVDIKFKQTNIINGIEEIQENDYKAFNVSSIIDEFKKFCADCDNKEKMLNYLKQVLK